MTPTPRRNRVVFSALIGAVLLATGAAQAVTGQEVLERIRRTYRRVNTLDAEFDHTFVWRLANSTQQTSGRFSMKKPHSFRIETEAQTVVTNGRTTWSYSPATTQVIITDYAAESMPLRPENFIFEFPDERSVTYNGEEELNGMDCHIINLVPQDSTLGITSMRVWVDDDEWMARKVEYITQDTNVTTYILRNVRINPRLRSSAFEFEAPEGTDVLDFRADADSGVR